MISSHVLLKEANDAEAEEKVKKMTIQSEYLELEKYITSVFFFFYWMTYIDFIYLFVYLNLHW